MFSFLPSFLLLHVFLTLVYRVCKLKSCGFVATTNKVSVNLSPQVTSTTYNEPRVVMNLTR
jgi:hypothetical protein